VEQTTRTYAWKFSTIGLRRLDADDHDALSARSRASIVHGTVTTRDDESRHGVPAARKVDTPHMVSIIVPLKLWIR